MGIIVAVRNISFVLLISLPTLLVNAQASASRVTAHRARYVLNLQSLSQREVRDVAATLVREGFDVAGVSYPKRTVELILNRSEFAAISARAGNRFRLSFAEEPKKPDQRYLNPVSLEKRMRDLARQFPQEAQLHVIGKTLQGRPILALEISSRTPTLKPNILVDGLHHAREVMTPEIALDVAETLLQARRNARIPLQLRRASLNLLESARIWIVPMVNPDGSNIVWSSDNFWRKNARSDATDTFGVDINRNYPFQWRYCLGSSSNEYSETYRGAGPASEPETQALVALGDLIKPILYLSYHSFGELVLSPYGCKLQYTSEQALLNHFGKALANSLPVDSKNVNYTYDYGMPWEILYVVDGSSIDHFFAAYGSMSYVIEVNEGFQPSYELRAPTLAKHRIAWLRTMTETLNATQLVRVQDARGKPIAAKISFVEIKHKAGERPFSTDAQGLLFKVLAPGVYNLTVTGDGRVSQRSIQVGPAPGVFEIQL